MGMFKDMKRAKDALAQAPEQVALAQQMGAQASSSPPRSRRLRPSR